MKKSDFFDFFPLLSSGQKHQLLEKITGLDKNQLFFLDEIEIDRSQIYEIESQFKRQVPFEYIVQNSEFYGYDFFVDNRCLIPRNDTEVMVKECILAFFQKETSLIDIGTGSSCIAIASFLEAKKIGKIFLNNYVIDISKDALEVSRINLKKYNLEKIFPQIESNLLGFFLINGQFKFSKNVIITANLPYIKDNDFENMNESVYIHEPNLALYGGKETGFELYEQLIEQIFDFKNIYQLERVIAFFEIGFDQYEYSHFFLTQKGLKFEYFQDMAKIHRCIKVEF